MRKKDELNRYTIDSFETKLRMHKVLELKIANMSLGLALSRLVHFRNVLHIPNLVLGKAPHRFLMNNNAKPEAQPLETLP